MKYSFVFVFLLAFHPAFSQNADEIYWSEDRKLTWKDFKAPPPRYTEDAALTVTNLKNHYSSDYVTIDLEIRAIFKPLKSWVREEGKTDAILKHEQVHFDIVELFARKLRKKLLQASFSHSTFKKEIDALVKKHWEDCNEFQSDYDGETDHSKNAVKQKEWEEKVSRMLDEVKEFSSVKLSLRFGDD